MGQLGADYQSAQPLPVLLFGSSSGTDSPTLPTHSPQHSPTKKATNSPSFLSTRHPTFAVTRPTHRPKEIVTKHPVPSHRHPLTRVPTNPTLRPLSKSPSSEPIRTHRPVTTPKPISTNMPSMGRLPCDKCLHSPFALNYTLACAGLDKSIDCTTLADMWRSGVCRIAPFCTVPSPVVVALVPYHGCPYLQHQPICQVVFNPSKIVNCLPLCFQSPHW